MICNQTLFSTNITRYNALWKEMDHYIWWYFKHTITNTKRWDHSYEVSSYICNPFPLALIRPGNSFEEICKWEIGASNYLDISRIYLLSQDGFPTLLPSQASLPTHASFQEKRDSFHNFTISTISTTFHNFYRCFFVKTA